MFKVMNKAFVLILAIFILNAQAQSVKSKETPEQVLDITLILKITVI